MTTIRSTKTYLSVLTSIVAVSASAFLVQSTIAQPVEQKRMDPAQVEKMIEMRVDRMARAVKATPEQKAKLIEIAKTAQTDIKPLRDQIHTRMERAVADSKEILTPEQRLEWDAKMKSHGSMRERMRERFGDPMKKQ
jgi:Spy/CpxP family protein refolding chaperone